MRNLKKFLAMALAMLMLVACFNVVAFDDTKDSDYADAIQLLNDLQVIRGFDEKEFKPDENVARWQMALMIAKLATGKVEEDDARWFNVTNTTPFTDLNQDQYYGSIGYCYSNHIIIGATATTFEPTRGITFEEGLTMVVRALGYASDEMDAGYPWTYISKAVALGLDENLENIGYEDVLTRGQTAQLLFNALTAENAKKTSFAKEAFNLTEATIVLTATNKINVLGGDAVLKNGYVQFRTVDEKGQIGAVAYHCPAAELGITDAAERHLYHVWNVLSQDDFASFVKTTEVTPVTTTAVAKANNSRIVVDKTTYKLVDAFTSLNNRPTNKYTEPELIVRNENNGYALMSSYENDVVFPEIDLFDFNKDGAPDFGIYRSYSFGVLKDNYVTDLADAAAKRVYAINFDKQGVAAKAGDLIRYSYNTVNNALYIADVATRVDGIVGGIEKDKIAVGGQLYNVGIKGFAGTFGVNDLTTDLLGKKCSIYLMKDPAGNDKVIYFDNYKTKGAPVVYAGFIALNQAGYPNVYAYAGSDAKSIITITSIGFETYRNYWYGNDQSVWYNNFLNEAKVNDLFWGTQDLDGNYDLSSMDGHWTGSNATNFTFKNSQTTLGYTDANGSAKTVTVSDSTLYVIGDGNHNYTVARGKAINTTAAKSGTVAESVGNYYASNSLVYIENAAAYDTSILTGDSASDTIVYLDNDSNLIAAQGLDGQGDGFTWKYTYGNVIDVKNGGLLSYDLTTFGFQLKSHGFYKVEGGVVKEALTLGVGGYYDAEGTLQVITFEAGAITGAGAKTFTVNGTKFTSGANFNGFVVLPNGDVKNTASDNVAPKAYANNGVYYGTAATKAGFVYNYSNLTAGTSAIPSLALFLQYYTDFDNYAYRSGDYYNYVPYGFGTAVTVGAQKQFYQYSIFQTTSIGADTMWDRLYAAVGSKDVTNAIQFYAEDGTPINAAAYGLKYEICDPIVAPDASGTLRKTTFLKISRDINAMMNGAFTGGIDFKNAFAIFKANGQINLCDQKFVISLAGFDKLATIIEGVSAVANNNQFVVYFDGEQAAQLGLSLSDVAQIISKEVIFLYKDGAKFSSVNSAFAPQQITGSRYAISFVGTLPFVAGSYTLNIAGVDVMTFDAIAAN